ncbi:MAG TPA: hypothetical protein VLA17_10475, partial [Candidatus Limnocylindria bacterium]|nr:hypothetical protein [Candidatus Limnocylindria bacterium]
AKAENYPLQTSPKKPVSSRAAASAKSSANHRTQVPQARPPRRSRWERTEIGVFETYYRELRSFYD